LVELIIIGFIAGIVAGISPCILPVLPVILVAGATVPEVPEPTRAGTDAGQTAGGEPTAPGRSDRLDQDLPHPVDGPVAAAETGSVLTLPPSEDVAPPSGSSGPPDGEAGPKRSWWRPQARPVSVVAGLVISFSLVILTGSEIISAFDLPQEFLRDAGVALLVAVGLSFLFPPLSVFLERPFARMTTGRQPNGNAGGFVLGLGLGLLFVPCAGPILAAITVAGATDRVGWTSVFLTVAFAIGAAVPLLVVAIAGSQLTQRVALLRTQAVRVRQVGGVIILIMALAIGLNTFSGLQRDVPGYTSALQSKIEGGQTVRKELNGLHASTPGQTSLASCNPMATSLINCGSAPNFTGITTWLNTPGGKPLSLAQLRGKVVLVDFWTYSCINCQRSLPHVESWYKDYAQDGLVVVGVHTPEFSFEHVVSNVRSEAASLGVKYPVAVDDDYKTWNAYSNEYWPAEYLIDAQGDIRHVSFGEGGYSDTEHLIRQLLSDAHPGAVLPRATDVPNKTPTGNQNPETYVGYEQEQYIENANLTQNVPTVYQFPSSAPLGGLGLSGTWTEGAQEATAGGSAEMELGFISNDVYLVMGGSGTVDVSVDGTHTETVNVTGVPKLYTLVRSSASTTRTLKLTFSPGVEAYDFTFG
jgi:cytochrome c biogenesis protein CcdA/thiol-disulfide isomerase/thioredoxin